MRRLFLPRGGGMKISFRYGYKAALAYLALFLGMLLLNFTMSGFEPFSLALLTAALMCGFSAPATAGLYILAGGISLTAGGFPFAVIAAQGVLLGGVYFLYARTGRAMQGEAVLLPALACALFLWIFGQYVYQDFARAAVIAAAIFALCFIFAGAMRCLLRAGTRMPGPEEVVFLAGAVTATGIGLYNCAGALVYESAALLALLLSCAAFKNGNAVFCALTLSLPAAICESVAAASPQLTACALFALYAAVALCFLRAGKLPAALALFLTNVAVRYLLLLPQTGSFTEPLTAAGFYLELLVPLIPCLIFALLLERALKALADGLSRYTEKPLTRASIDRSRARAGEKLFEASAAFREIESAFDTLNSDGEQEETARAFLADAVRREVCGRCEKADTCTAKTDAMDKLVSVGCAKGRVNLIDLPSALSSQCADPSGLLFALDKALAEYRRGALEEENATEGRKLLAEQAHGLAEALKKLALEMSAPVGIRAESERELRRALAKAGVRCEEALVGEEISAMTVGNAPREKVLAAAEEALGYPVALSAKRALTKDRYIWILRRAPRYDAAFGSASATKEGENACGDTFSVSRIDERTFLCALSDGMGSGEYARRISDCALSLTESFYRAGLDGDTVLSTVNRLLTFNREESFACMDIATVSLDTGAADIVKIGSPLGFILRADRVEVLESDSLPLGILDGVRPTVMRRTLGEGDVLLFVSDGITAAFGSGADVADFLCREQPTNPQALAEELVQAAKERTGGRAGDDMTALAVRLFERAA